MRHPKLFSDQAALSDYARDHHLLIAWEGTQPWRKRLELLSPEKFKAAVVMCSTPRGMTRAVLVSEAVVRARARSRCGRRGGAGSGARPFQDRAVRYYRITIADVGSGGPGVIQPSDNGQWMSTMLCYTPNPLTPLVLPPSAA